MRRNRWVAAVIFLTSTFASSPAGLATEGPPCIPASTCGTTSDEAFLGLMNRPQVLGLPTVPEGAKPKKSDPNPPRYEYVSLPACAPNDPNIGRTDIMCSRALTSCPPELEGNLRLNIWRRLVDPPKEPTRWTYVGATCHNDIAPGAGVRLTMADLKAEFLRIPWAQPTITIEPKGEVTLVNLKTFYRVTWSEAGYEPGEARSRTLVGVPVQLRPRLVGFTYDFGDGGTFGPTTSAGGRYPDGDVVHTYAEPGTFTARVVTTFAAEFSLDGGSTWDEIPTTVDVPGPPTTITVREMKAVLVR